MHTSNRTRTLAVLLALAVGLAACGPAPTAQPEPGGAPAGGGPAAAPDVVPTENTLRVNLQSGFPDIIDPQKSSFLAEIAHLVLAYEGLTALDVSGEVIAGAAERWESNEDASEWTFHLRPGLTYSDGSPLNARRFEYAILRNIDPQTGGEYGYITDEIAGAEAWRYGEAPEEQAQGEATVRESVRASHADGAECEGYDDAECRVLTLRLSRPAPYYPSVMALWVTYPVKEEVLVAAGEDWWIDPANHIGNGPYVYWEMEPQVRSLFVPNPAWHDEMGMVNIEFSYVTESAIAFQAYRNDEFDIIQAVAEDLETILADPTLSQEYMEHAGSCTFGFIFHRGKEPFDDPKVRQAFAMALDREAHVRDVLHGLGLPSLTWIPDGFPGHADGETRWGYDPEAARKALAESRYDGPEGLPKIVDTFPDTARQRVRHEWLVAQWREVLGVDVELNPVEPTTYSALTKDVETAPQLFLLGWCADYPDPQNWLSGYWKTGAQAYLMVGFSDPEIDAALTEADSTLDQEERMALYARAQDMVIDDCPAAFMYHTTNNYLVKPWVKGLQPNPMDFTWPGSFAPTSIDIDTSLLP